MASISLQEFLGGSTIISDSSIKDDEEEKKRKKAELEKLLKEESKEEDFISAKEAGIKISPLSDFAKKENIITQLSKDKDKKKSKEKKTITLKEFLGDSVVSGSADAPDVMKGSVLDGGTVQDGYSTWDDFKENLLRRTYLAAAKDTGQATVDTINWAGKKLGADEKVIDYQFEKIPEPDYFGGSLSRDLLGFAVPYFGVSKLAGAANLITKIPKATTLVGRSVRASLKGEAAAHLAFSPFEPRITNLIQMYPHLANPISEYLQADTKDSEDLARLKMTLEGGILGIAIDKLLSLVGRAKASGLKANQLKNTDKPIKNFNKVRKNEADIVDDATGVVPKSLRDDINIKSTVEKDIKSINKVVKDDLTAIKLNPRVRDRIANFMSDLFERAEVTRNPLIRISHQIYDVMTTPRIMKIIRDEKLLQKHKVSTEEIMNLFRSTIRESAQDLNRMSQLAKAYGKFLDDGKASKSLRKELENQGIDSELLLTDTFKRLDNIRRGMMVGRWATAARNFVSQVGRQGINVLNDAVRFGGEQLWTKLTGRRLQNVPADPIRTFQGFVDIFRQINPRRFIKVKKDVTNILSAFPKLKDRLFLRYSSDIQSATGTKFSPLGIGERAVDIFNVFNRFQEFITRRAVFQNALDAIIRGKPEVYGKGATLGKIVSDPNLMNTIRKKDLASAIDIALEATYALNPKTGIAKTFVEFVNKMPFTLSLLIPFPRFLVNSLKFLFEYSPLSTARGVAGVALDIPSVMLSFSADGTWTKGFLKRLSKGDVGGMSKAILGWGIFATAYQIRGSKLAGEKWNEIVVGDKTIDTLPYNPLAAYLYVADLVHRYQKGLRVFPKNPTKELMKVFAGTRGGTGLYMVDQVIDLLSSDMSSQKMNKVVDFVGKIANQYMTPFKTYVNLYEGGKEFITGEPVPATKDTRTAPLEFEKNVEGFIKGSGESIKRNFKSIFNKEELPDYTSTTHAVFDPETNTWVARPLRAEGVNVFGKKIPAPFISEFTGLTIRQEKNAAEKEMDRLNIAYNEIFRTTGIPFLDREYKNVLAPQIHIGLSKLVTSQKYLSLNPNIQLLIVKEFLTEAKKNAMTALQSKPELIPYLMEYQISNIPKTQRQALNSVLGKDYIDTLIKEFQSGKR